jgi:hypothetical protein
MSSPPPFQPRSLPDLTEEEEQKIIRDMQAIVWGTADKPPPEEIRQQRIICCVVS